MSDDSNERAELRELTTSLVAAYVGNNAVTVSDLPSLIGAVFDKLSGLGAPAAEPEVDLKPAVPIKKSITDEKIICLECGKQFKTIKRHLKTKHSLSPNEYRVKWSLSDDYPMASPSHAEKRRKIAKHIGLGRKPKNPTPSRKKK